MAAKKKLKIAFQPIDERVATPPYRSPRSAAIIDENLNFLGSRTFDGPGRFGLAITPKEKYPYTLHAVDTETRTTTEVRTRSSWAEPEFRKDGLHALVVEDGEAVYDVDFTTRAMP